MVKFIEGKTDPMQIYDSFHRKPQAIQEFFEVISHRFLLFQLVRRDILTRYKRSFLGVAWTMLNPLGTMIVMTVVFSHLFGGTKGYPAYVLSGIIAWNFFSKSTYSAMNSLVWGSNLIRRVFLPLTSFSLSSIGTESVNLTMSLVPLAIVMLIVKVPFHLSLFFLPISIILLACFSLGLSLLLSTFAIYFPDVIEMYQIILTAWMYLTPVIYPMTMFPEKYRFILYLNPMTYFIQLFHIPIFDGRFPVWGEIWPALVCGIIMLILGWLTFTRKNDEFAYRV